jgi:hypothetical protein
MPLFSSKPKLCIEDCCSQFYDNYLSHAESDYDYDNDDLNTDDIWLFYNYIKKPILEVAPSFSLVDEINFKDEIDAIRTETFALAWAERFKKEQYTYPQSSYTYKFLSDKEKANIWNTMEEYNQIIAESAVMNAQGEKFSGAVGRAIITQVSSMRVSLFKDWYKNKPRDEIQDKCIVRAINRFGANIRREDCLVTKLLANKLIERLESSTNGLTLNSEAFFRLSATVFGFCKGAEDYLKAVDIQI